MYGIPRVCGRVRSPRRMATRALTDPRERTPGRGRRSAVRLSRRLKCARRRTAQLSRPSARILERARPVHAFQRRAARATALNSAAVDRSVRGATRSPRSALPHASFRARRRAHDSLSPNTSPLCSASLSPRRACEQRVLNPAAVPVCTRRPRSRSTRCGLVRA